MKKMENKSCQTRQIIPFILYRDNLLFNHLRFSNELANQRLIDENANKVEEFILDKIGNDGIYGNSKRFNHCYLRNKIHHPNLFRMNQNKLFCLFEQRLEWLAIFLQNTEFYKSLMRLLKNMYKHRLRLIIMNSIFQFRIYSKLSRF